MRIFGAAASLFATLLFGAIGTDAQAKKTIWDGAFSDAQAARGEAIYRQKCSYCHGDDLRGHTVDGPPIKGPQFETRWTGMTLLDIVTEVSAMMPEPEPGSLPKQDYVDVLAFIFRENGAKMGPADVQTDDAVLIQIEGTAKPR